MSAQTPQQAALLKRLANTLLALLAILAVAWLAFGFLYYWVEDYRLIESLHWSMQTISTVGYGDVAPQTDGGMILAMLLQPLAVTSTLLLGANFVRTAIEDPGAYTHEEQVEARRCDDDTNRVSHAILSQVQALSRTVAQILQHPTFKERL